MDRSVLSPEYHVQRDFFVADILDAAPKADLASMEHPLFALKSGDKRIRRYEHRGATIEIQPGTKGLATIHDKDVWIYCVSHLVEAMNRGRKDVGRTVRFTGYDFLTSTHRQTSGQGYLLLAEALERLKGTTVVTNVSSAGRRARSGFGLLDAFEVVERGPDDRMVAVSVTLPDWLYGSVEAKQMLTLSRAYFRIRKPLDRRLYELARKHCGSQARWTVSVGVLYKKSGSTSALKKFRFNVKTLSERNELPDYRVVLDARADMVTFYAKSHLKAGSFIR